MLSCWLCVDTTASRLTNFSFICYYFRTVYIYSSQYDCNIKILMQINGVTAKQFLSRISGHLTIVTWHCNAYVASLCLVNFFRYYLHLHIHLFLSPNPFLMWKSFSPFACIFPNPYIRPSNCYSSISPPCLLLLYFKIISYNVRFNSSLVIKRCDEALWRLKRLTDIER